MTENSINTAANAVTLHEAFSRLTPGTWRVGKVVPGEPDAKCGTRIIEAPYDGDPQTLAFVHPSTDGAGAMEMERDANARLFAASKLLLAVALCENALAMFAFDETPETEDELEHVLRRHGYTDDLGDTQAYRFWIDELRNAAIAKATSKAVPS